MHRISKLLTKGPSSRILSHLTRTTRGYASSVKDGSGKGAARAFTTHAAAEPFLSGSSSTYVEEMYLAWQRNPESVHKVIQKTTVGLGVVFNLVVAVVCDISGFAHVYGWHVYQK